MSGGSWAVCSPEQSDETVGIAGIGLVSTRKHKPCVAMVCDLKSNAKKVHEGLQILLRPFDIEVRYRDCLQVTPVHSCLFGPGGNRNEQHTLQHTLPCAFAQAKLLSFLHGKYSTV